MQEYHASLIWYRKNGHFPKSGLLTIQEVFNDKENKKLRMKREILKKAAAFFAKESG